MQLAKIILQLTNQCKNNKEVTFNKISDNYSEIATSISQDIHIAIPLCEPVRQATISCNYICPNNHVKLKAHCSSNQAASNVLKLVSLCAWTFVCRQTIVACHFQMTFSFKTLIYHNILDVIITLLMRIAVVIASSYIAVYISAIQYRLKYLTHACIKFLWLY